MASTIKERTNTPDKEQWNFPNKSENYLVCEVRAHNGKGIAQRAPQLNESEKKSWESWVTQSAQHIKPNQTLELLSLQTLKFV